MESKVMTASDMGKKSWKNRMAKDPVGVREKMREMGLNSGIARRKKREERLAQQLLDKQT